MSLVFAAIDPGGRGDSNIWWIDVRWLSGGLDRLFLLFVSVALLWVASGIVHSRTARRSITILLAAALAVSLINSVTFWVLLGRGSIFTRVPVPVSLLIACMLTFILWTHARATVRVANRAGSDNGSRHGLVAWVPVNKRSVSRSRRPNSVKRSAYSQPPIERTAKGTRTAAIMNTAGVLVVASVCVSVAPLIQMVGFGGTDYRRRADAAVVFGARAYADGRLSLALEDRVRTACDLYDDGLVDRLIFSGGPGDGDIHETEAMRRFAIEHGIPAEAITLDPAGLNTRATVAQTEAMFAELGVQRVLAVSHGYHLPRVKLTYQHVGREVYTVPARETRTLAALPFNMAREVAAWWAYAVGVR